jgi:hypothetical protein
MTVIELPSAATFAIFFRSSVPCLPIFALELAALLRPTWLGRARKIYGLSFCIATTPIISALPRPACGMLEAVFCHRRGKVRYVGRPAKCKDLCTIIAQEKCLCRDRKLPISSSAISFRRPPPTDRASQGESPASHDTCARATLACVNFSLPQPKSRCSFS